MVATLTIRDETAGGARSEKIELQFPSETITVRKIIRERVYQEVQDYNRRKGEMFRGLVQPSGSEGRSHRNRLPVPPRALCAVGAMNPQRTEIGEAPPSVARTSTDPA